MFSVILFSSTTCAHANQSSLFLVYLKLSRSPTCLYASISVSLLSPLLTSLHLFLRTCFTYSLLLVFFIFYSCMPINTYFYFVSSLVFIRFFVLVSLTQIYVGFCSGYAWIFPSLVLSRVPFTWQRFGTIFLLIPSPAPFPYLLPPSILGLYLYVLPPVPVDSHVFIVIHVTCLYFFRLLFSPHFHSSHSPAFFPFVSASFRIGFFRHSYHFTSLTSTSSSNHLYSHPSTVFLLSSIWDTSDPVKLVTMV